MENVEMILRVLDAESKCIELSEEDYIGYLDIIYRLYTGLSFEKIYNMYTTPKGNREGSKCPVAWYKTGYDINQDYPCGPDNMSGFIPDRINSTVFSKDSPSKRVMVLNYMFDELKGLYEAV